MKTGLSYLVPIVIIASRTCSQYDAPPYPDLRERIAGVKAHCDANIGFKRTSSCANANSFRL